MERCAACGAALTAGAVWCGQCFAPVGAPAAATATPARFVPGRYQPIESLPAPLRTTRWGKTPTTFGPAGRLVATLALLVPLAVMVVGGIADPFVWGGAGVWAAVIMPWALRDIWKAGRLPAA